MVPTDPGISEMKMTINTYEMRMCVYMYSFGCMHLMSFGCMKMSCYFWSHCTGKAGDVT